MRQFLNENLLKNVEPATTNGTSDVVSDHVDMANGALGVVFLCAIATKAVGNYIKVQQSDTTTDGDFSDIEGSKAVALVDADMVAVEVFKPAKRYLRAFVARGTSTLLGPIHAIQYMPRVQPPSANNSTGIVSKILITPEEGTA